MPVTSSGTVRDAVWDAAFRLTLTESAVTINALLATARLTDQQRDTARDVLNTMTDYGWLAHESGTTTWHRDTTRSISAPAASDPPRTDDVTYLRSRNARKYTFEDPAIRNWVEARLHGHVLNLCCGQTHLDYDGPVHRNDIDIDRDADTHFDAVTVGERIDSNTFDTVVVDPPWSSKDDSPDFTKRRDRYGDEYVDSYAQMKDGVESVLRPGGRCITFGYDSSGLGAGRGAIVEEIALINFTGNHNDAIAVVERLTDE